MPENNTSGHVGEQPQDSGITSDDSREVVGEQPQDEGQTAEITDATIDDLSPEQLEAIISGEPLPDQENETDDTTQTETHIDTTTEEVTNDNEGDEGTGDKPQPEATVTKDTDTEQDKAIAPKRIRLSKLEEDQAAKIAHIVNGVSEGVYPDVETAAAAIFPGLKGQALNAVKDAADVESTSTSESDTTPVIPDAVAQVDAEIADLRAQRKKAKAEYDTDVEAQLQDKIEDAFHKKQQIERQEATIQNERGAYNGAFQESVQATLTQFPDLNNEKSELTKRVQELRDLAEFREDAIMDDPTFLAQMTKQAADELGLTSKGGKPASQQARQVKPQPTKQARPVGTVASGNEGFGNMSKVDALHAADNLTQEQLEEVLESSFV